MYEVFAMGVLLVGTPLPELGSPSFRTKNECGSVCGNDDQCIGFVVHPDEQCRFFSSIDYGEKNRSFTTYVKEYDDIIMLNQTPKRYYKQMCGKMLEGGEATVHSGRTTPNECADQCSREHCAGFELDGNGNCITFSIGIHEVDRGQQGRKFFILSEWDSNAGWTFNPETNAFYKELLIPYASWTDSNSRCQTEGGQLVSIHSETENQFLQSIFSNSEYHYIGMKCTNLSCGWTDKTLLDYKNWWSTYPTRSTQCAVMCPVNQTWEDQGCDAFRPAICKKLSYEGWKYYSQTKSWYKVIGSYTWTIAEEKCRTIGGHLTSILSATEKSIVTALAVGYFHIGYRCTNSVCSWLDGSRLSYNNWCSGSPTTSMQCVSTHLDTTKCWDGNHCSSMLTTICKRTS